MQRKLIALFSARPTATGGIGDIHWLCALYLKLARPVLFLFCAFQLSKYIIKGASKNKVDVTVTSEQIQHRAYLIAERRERFGVSGDETGDWAQAERELGAETTGK